MKQHIKQNRNVTTPKKSVTQTNSSKKHNSEMKGIVDNRKVAPDLKNSKYMTQKKGTKVIQRSPQQDQCRLIAQALRSWLENWATGDRQAAINNLRNNWDDAADELQALLLSIDLGPRPGNLTARQTNSTNFPDVPPIILIDLLTPLNDLRTFGPTQGFRPFQSMYSILSFYNVFDRLS